MTPQPDSIFLSKVSSDSSFQRTFKILLEQSEGLRWQYREILRRKLNTDDDLYSDFLKKIVEKNKKLQQEKLFKSMPNQYRRASENIFTFEKIVNFIENEKANSSVNLRLMHSDQSWQLLKSNSVR